MPGEKTYTEKEIRDSIPERGPHKEKDTRRVGEATSSTRDKPAEAKPSPTPTK